MTKYLLVIEMKDHQNMCDQCPAFHEDPEFGDGYCAGQWPEEPDYPECLKTCPLGKVVSKQEGYSDFIGLLKLRLENKIKAEYLGYKAGIPESFWKDNPDCKAVFFDGKVAGLQLALRMIEEMEGMK